MTDCLGLASDEATGRALPGWTSVLPRWAAQAIDLDQ
jgi:hypothetical protein